jgi:hypothetical protein
MPPSKWDFGVVNLIRLILFLTAKELNPAIHISYNLGNVYLLPCAVVVASGGQLADNTNL